MTTLILPDTSQNLKIYLVPTMDLLCLGQLFLVIPPPTLPPDSPTYDVTPLHRWRKESDTSLGYLPNIPPLSPPPTPPPPPLLRLRVGLAPCGRVTCTQNPPLLCTGYWVQQCPFTSNWQYPLTPGGGERHMYSPLWMDVPSGIYKQIGSILSAWGDHGYVVHIMVLLLVKVLLMINLWL